jgi:hypothetical protein
MKKLFILLTTILTNTVFAQLTYVDNFDGVYPFPVNQGIINYNFDINGDGQNDIGFRTQSTSTTKFAWFIGLSNTFGQNKVNSTSTSATIPSIDCSNDTINSMSAWENLGTCYLYGPPATNAAPVYLTTVGFGAHKQGFRLVITNPMNGSLGYKFGYINYTLTNSGDVIIHDWYYENTFNVPIVANSQLQYPYDGNCIHYDTVTVQDTLVTQVYDTITTHINVYDTVLVSVTDTLIINTTLNLPAPNNTNIIKVYPNPASDHITIDNGNFALMNGYSIKIENSTGQQVFNASVNQAQFYIDISSWTGNGLYFIHLIDPTNNTVTIRKLVVQ